MTYTVHYTRHHAGRVLPMTPITGLDRAQAEAWEQQLQDKPGVTCVRIEEEQ